MARCNCSDTRCSCIIKAGAGVTVTGSGRPDNPYTVSAEGGGGGGGGGFGPGDIKWTARGSAPAGWLIADGATVSRTTYSALFDAIGTLYGSGDGVNTFTLPDYTGRFMLGSDGAHPPGSSGGDERRTLTATQVPKHTHVIDHDHTAFTTAPGGAHDHALRLSNSAGSSTSTVDRGGALATTSESPIGDSSHAHAIDVPPFKGSSGDGGGGEAFSIMPPYTTALPLIKT